MIVDEQIFVPDVGFRPVDTMIARVPVTRAAAGRTVTVERAVSGPSGVDVVLVITGAPSGDTRQMPSFATDPVTVREPGGRTVTQILWRCGVGRIAGPPANALETVRRTLATEPLDPGTNTAELDVCGVTVPLEFEPARTAVPAYPLDAVVERHGIAVAGRRIAFAENTTAIELTVAVSGDARTAIYMIGMSLGPNACDVGLRDDTGRVYGGQRTLGDGHRGGRFHEVALFPALPAGVRTVSLEIAMVSVIEQTPDLTLPLRFDDEITLAGLTGHVRVLRESDAQRERRRERLPVRMSVLPPGAPRPADEEWGRVELECGEGPWLGDRKLIRPDSLWLTDRAKRCSYSYSDRGWVLSAPDPTGDVNEVTISSALVRCRGPWQLDIPLPPRT